jgi:hypothetical protein
MVPGERASRRTDAPDPMRALGAVLHRWPTALGIAVGTLTVADVSLAEGIEVLSPLLIIMALVYIGAGALGRPRAAWAVLLGALPTLILLDGGEVAAVVLLAAAAVFLAIGAARGRIQQPSGRLQVAGLAGFGAVALLALALDPGIARYLLAVGIIGHGLWDFAHLLRNRVVARSYAEFCGVLDLLVGMALLVLV